MISLTIPSAFPSPAPSALLSSTTHPAFACFEKSHVLALYPPRVSNFCTHGALRPKHTLARPPSFLRLVGGHALPSTCRGHPTSPLRMPPWAVVKRTRRRTRQPAQGAMRRWTTIYEQLSESWCGPRGSCGSPSVTMRLCTGRTLVSRRYMENYTTPTPPDERQVPFTGTALGHAFFYGEDVIRSSPHYGYSNVSWCHHCSWRSGCVLDHWAAMTTELCSPCFL